VRYRTRYIFAEDGPVEDVVATMPSGHSAAGGGVVYQRHSGDEVQTSGDVPEGVGLGTHPVGMA
jgi:hypothetical protein